MKVLSEPKLDASIMSTSWMVSVLNLFKAIIKIKMQFQYAKLILEMQFHHYVEIYSLLIVVINQMSSRSSLQIIVIWFITFKETLMRMDMLYLLLVERTGKSKEILRET